MIKRNLALTENYGDQITFVAQKLEEPITKQYLENCPKNATYRSNTATESMVDAMKSLSEINESNFITLYTEAKKLLPQRMLCDVCHLLL